LRIQWVPPQSVFAREREMKVRKTKLLVVQADPIYAGLLQDVLRPVSPFELIPVGRFDEALRQLGAGSFDAVLLDPGLPDRMGLAVYRDLRDASPALPVVLLTGSDDEALAQQAVREGAQDYLVKGEFEGKMLAHVIHCAIERKRAEEGLRQGAEILKRKQQMETLEKTLSELHQAHEELKAAQMQLVQSEKLEAVSTFAGGIAHEVKNPLQTILLGVDFLRNSFPEANQDVQMVLDDMDSAAARADAVIRGLLEFSAYNKRDVKEQDLSRIVGQALRSVKVEMASHSIRLTEELAPNLPLVRLDLKTIKHVLINLLLGAIQAMSGGGTLSVRTCLRPLAADPGWSGRTPAQLKAGDIVVAAEVEDDGPGVIESRLTPKSKRVFGTELIRKGVLDLLVLKKVVELYGGMIQIINRIEGGVKVTIMFKVPRKE
jgi:signal transduction histidine kinase